MATIRYCEHLFQNFDTRLSCFISLMGPFVDPGSKCFGDLDRFGYRLLAHPLEENRQLLVQSSWEKILNYETRWMSRDDLVDVSYDAAEALNTLKLKYARIDTTRGQNVAKRVSQAKGLKNRLKLNTNNQEEMSSIERKMLLGEIHDFSISWFVARESYSGDAI